MEKKHQTKWENTIKNPYLKNNKWYWFDKKHREQLLQIGNDIFGPYEKYEQALKDFNIYHKQNK